MRILFLTQILPYPPDSGPRVKTWNVLRYLSRQGHEVTLVSFVRAEEIPYLAAVTDLVKKVYPVPMRRSRPKDLIQAAVSILTGKPFLVVRDNLPAMQKVITSLAQTEKYDIVQADQVTMAQFALLFRSASRKNSWAGAGENPGPLAHLPALVFDAHNATWVVLERSRRYSPAWVRPWLESESRRLHQYEGEIVRSFDRTLTVSEEDRQALIQAAGGDELQHLKHRIVAIPIAVDTQTLQPVSRTAEFQITTLGTLYYPPNADGIRWFANEVFPLIQAQVPRVTFTIVGRRPPPDFVQLAENQPGVITLTGYLPDLVPCLEKTAVLVVPVRSGGGMRVRILEAFARGVPVVTTTTGAEGIQAVPGKDLLIADTPEDFARAVIELLHRPQLQADLAASGRKLAVTRYDWQAVLPALDQIYQVLAGGREVA